MEELFVGIAAHGLTGLALLAGNVKKRWNFYKPTFCEPAPGGQVRVETLVSG